MTLLAFCCFLAILLAAGLPFTLLLRADENGRRVLLLPVFGLCGIVLFTCFLASFGLTGWTIAKAALVAVAGAGGGAILAARWTTGRYGPGLSRGEWVAALPGYCAGLAACLIIAWPLFLDGSNRYWGFANPDQAFYMTIVDYLDSHSFGQPPAERFHMPSNDPAHTAGNPAAILGLSYLLPMVSTLTGVASPLLFSVLCAVMVFLLPVSVFTLCRAGLQLPAAFAFIAGLLIATSAVAAQTFYQHSLGALTVAAVCPAALAVAMLYARDPKSGYGHTMALLLAGMLFLYFPGFAVMGVVLVGALGPRVLLKRLPLRNALKVGLAAILISAVVYYSHAVSLLQALITETLSSRLSTMDDEILLSMATALTEEFVPFIWGLKALGLPPIAYFGSPLQVSAVLFCLGSAFFVIVLAGFRMRAFPTEFSGALAAAAIAIAFYFSRNNGYGVYKLVTWFQPLLIVGLLTASAALMASRNRLWRWVAVSALGLLGLFNIMQTAQLGRYSRGDGAARMHNAPEVRLSDMRALEESERAIASGPIFAAVPDQVLQRWIAPFMKRPNVHYLPAITLNVQDSDSALAVGYRRDVCARLRGGQLLYTRSALQDIVAPPDVPTTWRSRIFAMSPLDRVKNQLILGSGWYRREVVQRPSGSPIPFRWMRKRAEMLVLNPAAAPQSLSMTVRAGYGNVSPVRHLTILVNGTKLQDLKIEGQARFVTRPFSLSGRAAQIEILVRENAEPLPRAWGLWNRWVPRDARKLNLGVLSATLENGDSGGASDISEIDFRADPDFGGAAYDGVYADGWVAARASIAMRVPPNCQQVRIRGTAPGGTDLKFPLALRLAADGRQIGEGIVSQPGSFDVRVPFPHPLRSPPRDVVLDVNPSSSCFTNLAGGDTRCLTVRLDKMSLVAADR